MTPPRTTMMLVALAGLLACGGSPKAQNWGGRYTFSNTYDDADGGAVTEEVEASVIDLGDEMAQIGGLKRGRLLFPTLVFAATPSAGATPNSSLSCLKKEGDLVPPFGACGAQVRGSASLQTDGKTLLVSGAFDVRGRDSNWVCVVGASLPYSFVLTRMQ